MTLRQPLAKVELLADGRLADLDTWTENIAEELAANDGLQLTDDHRLVIEAMRAYYHEFGVSPVMKLLKRSLKEKTGSDRFDNALLQSLFPHG